MQTETTEQALAMLERGNTPETNERIQTLAGVSAQYDRALRGMLDATAATLGIADTFRHRSAQKQVQLAQVQAERDRSFAEEDLLRTELERLYGVLADRSTAISMLERKAQMLDAALQRANLELAGHVAGSSGNLVLLEYPQAPFALYTLQGATPEEVELMGAAAKQLAAEIDTLRRERLMNGLAAEAVEEMVALGEEEAAETARLVERGGFLAEEEEVTLAGAVRTLDGEPVVGVVQGYPVTQRPGINLKRAQENVERGDAVLLVETDAEGLPDVALLLGAENAPLAVLQQAVALIEETSNYPAGSVAKLVFPEA